MQIIPGPKGLQIVIPGREPIGECYACDTPFFSQADVRRHLASAGHRDRIEAARAEREAQKRRLAVFHEDDDPEISAHMREVGQRMLKEGRWTVKPNERAGFS
jgi:hypothetical protein